MSRSLHRFATLLREAFGTEKGGKLDSVAFGLLLLFVATVPFPYGGVLPAGRVRLELLSFLITALAFLSRRPMPTLRGARVAVAAVAALAVLGALQLLPLGEGVLSGLSPTSVKIYHETSEILGLFGRPPMAHSRVSIAPTQTGDAIRLILAELLLFVSAAMLLDTRARRRLFCAVLLAAAVVQVAIAGPTQLAEGRLHGTFVNPNHLAAYLELALAVAFGVLWADILVGPDRVRGISEQGARIEKRFLPLASRIFVWGIIAAGIALSESRAGIAVAIAVTGALLALGISHPRARSRRRRALGGALAVAAGVLFVAMLARGVPLVRFLASDPRDVQGGVRVELWKLSIDAWRQFPTVGSGLGAFREAFRRVQPRDLNGLVEQAHSDPLQLLVTGGVVGLVLGVTVYVSLLVILVRRWWAQKHREESAMILAGFGALLSIALHGLVEFPMSIPAIPATLACVLGMAWAAAQVRGAEVP